MYKHSYKNYNQNKYIMKEEKLIKNIDWSELRNQKRTLLEVINNDNVNPEQKEDLEGIMSLIDKLQDYAVDELNIDGTRIFDFEMEEDNFDTYETLIVKLKDIKFNTEEKKLLMSIINIYNTGQHPNCDEHLFNYFLVSYVIKIIKENNDEISMRLNEAGNVLFTSIKNNLGIV
jgi:hypothetical protein